jgi:hypothetical protein
MPSAVDASPSGKVPVFSGEILPCFGHLSRFARVEAIIDKFTFPVTHRNPK